MKIPAVSLRTALIAMTLALALFLVAGPRRREAFGTSPGTMVQLSTSHVPTEDDVYFFHQVYPRLVRREITELTDGDPGELRPWVFPWYGRGMVFLA